MTSSQTDLEKTLERSLLIVEVSMIKPPKVDTDVHVNELLPAPPEPIICWLDSGCPTSKQVRQARTPHAGLFILICVAIAGGLGMAEWHHNRAATSARAQSLTIVPATSPATGDILLERRPGDPG
jgi:hypothetical protein